MMSKLTMKELLVRLEKHEAECGIKLDGINKRLDESSNRFESLQNSIWGLYALIIAGGFSVVAALLASQ